MTNSLNSSNQIPAYSGITINITNPSLNPASVHHSYSNACQNPVCSVCHSNYADTNKENFTVTNPISDNVSNAITNNKLSKKSNESLNDKNNSNANNDDVTKTPTSYPAEYYLNNYNVQNSIPNNTLGNVQDLTPVDNTKNEKVLDQANNNDEKTLSTSNEIIESINNKIAEQKELEKNSKKIKVVALTNEYIMSLENHLNNPNKDLRIMAAQEILTRLDEDRDRYNDAALNALLNKMLQDPESLVRTAAMSAFASELASGNDYTIELLTKLQQNPNSSKDDILTASKILLKMSATTETKYVSVPVKTENQA